MSYSAGPSIISQIGELISKGFVKMFIGHIETDERNWTATTDLPLDAIDLTVQYIFGRGGAIHLTEENFNFMYNTAVNSDALDWESVKKIGNEVYTVPVDFYKTSFDLKNAYGRATFYLKEVNGQYFPIGFYDYWNLDSRSYGVRPGSAESSTRFFNAVLPGTSFIITYP